MNWKTPFIINLALLCMAVQCFHFDVSIILSKVTLSNQTATSVDAQSSLLDFKGAIIQHGHVWSKSPNPIVGSLLQSSLGVISEKSEFISSIKNLEPSSTYFIRAYVVADGQTYYGKESSFNTNAGSNKPPEYVNTLGISSISANTATATGDVAKLATGSTVNQYGHCWATSTNPTTSSSKTGNGTRSNTGNYTSELSGLSSGTKYYIRAYMITSTSNPTVLYGNEVSFTTPN